jgi:predicted DNA binding protein
MTATVAEVTASAADFALYKTFREFGDVRFEVERVAAGDGRVVPFVRVTHEDVAAVHEALDADSTTAVVEVLADLENERLYRIEWVDRVEAHVDALLERGGAVLSASGRNGQWLFRLLFPDRAALSRTYDHCADAGLDLSVERVFGIDEGRRGRYGLTDKQQDALQAAFERSYYSIPREVPAHELAAEIGVSHQALSERLRRAHETLLENTVMLGHEGDGDGSKGL